MRTGEVSTSPSLAAAACGVDANRKLVAKEFLGRETGGLYGPVSRIAVADDDGNHTDTAGLSQLMFDARTIDGVEIEFRLAPDSEAPSEMISYYPQFKVLNMAEDTTHTLHNLYTIRGAAIRDGRLWSKYIGEAIERLDALPPGHAAALLKREIKETEKYLADLRAAGAAVTP